MVVAGCEKDPEVGSQKAIALGDQYMRSMSDTLAQSKAFTFETDEHLEILAPDGLKHASDLGRKVTVRRPDGVAFELSGKDNAASDLSAFYDGKTATLSSSNGTWAQTAVPGTLDEMLNDVARRFGLPVPIGDVMYKSPYDAYLGKSSKGGFVGREIIDGVEYAKVDYADDVVHVRLWIPSKGQAVPRRLEIAYKKAPVPLKSSVDFKNWNLDAQVTDANFEFKPPAGHLPMDFGNFVYQTLTGKAAPSEAPVRAGKHTKSAKATHAGR
jgi:hypothetical protein